MLFLGQKAQNGVCVCVGGGLGILKTSGRLLVAGHKHPAEVVSALQIEKIIQEGTRFHPCHSVEENSKPLLANSTCIKIVFV